MLTLMNGEMTMVMKSFTVLELVGKTKENGDEDVNSDDNDDSNRCHDSDDNNSNSCHNSDDNDD